MTIGKRIKNRRKELGLSVDEVAERLGKNRATIYRYENDDIENLPITVLKPLAAILKTTPSYLIGWDDTVETLTQSSMTIGDIAHEMKIPVDAIERFINENNANSLAALKKTMKVAETRIKAKSDTDDPSPQPLVIPDELKGVKVAFHRGEFEDLTQDEVDALAILAKTLKEQRKKKEGE